jgi:malate dehydrogenase (oxaloacetate-decarboxylating)(NADP+)
MNIPIMHDDQHGTAIIAGMFVCLFVCLFVCYGISSTHLQGAGLLNALLITGKNIRDIKVISCGAGAAGKRFVWN